MGDLNLYINYNKHDHPLFLLGKECYKSLFELVKKLMNELSLVQCNRREYNGRTEDIFLFNGGKDDVVSKKKEKFLKRNGNQIVLIADEKETKATRTHILRC